MGQLNLDGVPIAYYTDGLEYVTTSLAGLSSTNQNSTTGMHYAQVDMSNDIPDGCEIVSVGVIGNFDAFYYVPHGRSFLVCSPRSYSVPTGASRDVRVWYRKV